MAVFPPYVAYQGTYFSPACIDHPEPIPGKAYGWGGFHFWGYRGERIEDRNACSYYEDHPGDHNAGHKVAWFPFIVIESLGVIAIWRIWRKEVVGS